MLDNTKSWFCKLETKSSLQENLTWNHCNHGDHSCYMIQQTCLKAQTFLAWWLYENIFAMVLHETEVKHFCYGDCINLNLYVKQIDSSHWVHGTLVSTASGSTFREESCNGCLDFRSSNVFNIQYVFQRLVTLKACTLTWEIDALVAL